MNTSVAAIIASLAGVVWLVGLAIHTRAVVRDRARRNQRGFVWSWRPFNPDAIPHDRADLERALKGMFLSDLGFTVMIAVICYAKGRGW